MKPICIIRKLGYCQWFFGNRPCALMSWDIRLEANSEAHFMHRKDFARM